MRSRAEADEEATRAARLPLAVAATAGALHAAFSLYWAAGGKWLIETLGERILSAFRGFEWVLFLVGAVKLAGAILPSWLNARGWPGGRLWRPLCWIGSGGLIAWGGANTVVANLVLTGVVTPDGGYHRPGMIGHGWLWDPLFLVWGVALAIGLWLSRRRTVTAEPSA